VKTGVNVRQLCGLTPVLIDVVNNMGYGCLRSLTVADINWDESCKRVPNFKQWPFLFL